MFDRILTTFRMMAVDRYSDSISNKTKISFKVLAKKTQSALILDNMPVLTI